MVLAITGGKFARQSEPKLPWTQFHHEHVVYGPGGILTMMQSFLFNVFHLSDKRSFHA